ncbi:hypothetical protein, partial [Amycolatopsis echigonensis]|uniref:hypothetical protein n=1 Tax=Amycolatopsis echigonensis TaxID=2576905 RepID=UPI001C82546B
SYSPVAASGESLPIGFAGDGAGPFLGEVEAGLPGASLAAGFALMAGFGEVLGLGVGDEAAPELTTVAGLVGALGVEAGLAGGFEVESAAGSAAGCAARFGLGLPAAFGLVPVPVAGFGPGFGL